MITSPAPSQTAAARQWFLAREDFGAMVEAIRGTGRCVIGPTIREDAIVYDEIHAAADLPIGWRDVQTAGRYRLEHGGGRLSRKKCAEKRLTYANRGSKLL